MKKLILFISILFTVNFFAAEYDSVVASGQTEYIIIKEKVVKLKYSVVPVGGILASSRELTSSSEYEKIFISSISADTINIGQIRKTGIGNYSTESAQSLGVCKVNSELIVRSDNSYPALRVKLIKVDMENGTATVIVTKFWPFPNSPTTKEFDPPTTPEAEPVNR